MITNVIVLVVAGSIAASGRLYQEVVADMNEVDPEIVTAIMESMKWAGYGWDDYLTNTVIAFCLTFPAILIMLRFGGVRSITKTGDGNKSKEVSG